MPMVSDAKNVRKAAAVPAFSVSVVIVWLASNVTSVIPADVRPANDSVLNVFAPVIVMLVAAALVKLTLLKVCDPPLNVGTVEEQERVDVPAVKVKFVDVINEIGVLPDKIIVLPLKEIDRMFELVDERLFAVIA